MPHIRILALTLCLGFPLCVLAKDKDKDKDKDRDDIVRVTGSL